MNSYLKRTGKTYLTDEKLTALKFLQVVNKKDWEQFYKWISVKPLFPLKWPVNS